jgi:hypothetical protein
MPHYLLLQHLVPTPVAAVLLLFPVSEGYLEYREATQPNEISEIPDGLFFMKQTIGND